MKQAIQKTMLLAGIALFAAFSVVSIEHFVDMGVYVSNAAEMVPVEGAIAEVSRGTTTMHGYGALQSDKKFMTVRFSYEFDRQQYESNAVAFGCEFECEASTVRRYFSAETRELEKGAPTTVWVDPSRPSRVFLFKATWIELLKEIGATGFVLFVLLVFFFVLSCAYVTFDDKRPH